MKKNGNGYTAQQLIDAINEGQGYVSQAAKIMGISRKTFYVYLKKYKSARDTLEDVREARHDWVESKFMENIKAGNVTAQIFYLKTQAKHRGYIERWEHEHSGPDKGPIQVTKVEVVKDYGDSDSSTD